MTFTTMIISWKRDRKISSGGQECYIQKAHYELPTKKIDKFPCH